MKNYKIYVICVVFLCTAFLISCSNNTATEPEISEKETKESVNKPTKGGAITGAIYDAPTGMFNPLFSEDAYEKNILDFTHESLFVQNDSLEFEAHLAKKKWKLNKDQTELTVHLKENVTWHDGEPFTAEDVVFTYQTIADPDYVKAGGIQSNYVADLVDGKKYAEGKTDNFTGVVAKDDHTVTFQFVEPAITPERYASFPIIPKHIFEDMSVTDIPHAKESQEPGHVIGTGPFVFSDMKARDYYTLERYEDYWQDAPYLDEIMWKVTDPSSLFSLLKDGEIDFVATPHGFHAADFNLIHSLGNMEIVEQPGFYYQLLGFKHHHQTPDETSGGDVTPEEWTSNDKIPQKVRQAIAYAIDREKLIGKDNESGLLYGKGETLNAPIATSSWAYDEETAANYEYNVEKAEEMLDKAGYKRGEKDFRTTPDGEEWVLNLDYPSGNEIREKAAPRIKEDLEKIGIKINLRKPKAMSTFISDLTMNDTDWDLYLIGWELDKYDPNPLGLWGTEDVYNFSRWQNSESDELLQHAIETPEAFDQDFRAEAYAEWQHVFSEDLPGLPLFTQNTLWAYNKRIKGVQALPYTMYHDSHLWWIDEEEE